MRIKIFLKKFISIGVAAILSAASVGCFDLGGFSDDTEYYETFGDVRLVYQNPGVTDKDVETQDYSIQDYFYNKNTGEDFVYGDPKDEEPDDGKDIPQLLYTYMAIPVEQDLNIDSVALYFNALQTCALEVVFYVVDELPNGGKFTEIRLLGEPEYQQKLDDEGKPEMDENNQPILDKILYSDPDDESIVARSTVYVSENKWVALVMEANNSIQVKGSQYLLLRFLNNCGAGTGENPSVAFRVTNLLVRAFP